MKVGIVSEHANPLAAIGGEDAGGQNIHVAALSAALARRGHSVTVYTRRERPDQPVRAPLTAGVMVEHVPAGPARAISKDRLMSHMPEFADRLAARWRRQPPDLVHAHFWMSGFAALRAANTGCPVVQTFHALGSQKRRHQGKADTSPPERITTEAAVGRRASAIIATSTDEVRELGQYDVSPEQTFVVPCGVDTRLFRPAGACRGEHLSAWPRQAEGARVLTIGRLVKRKGMDTVIEAVAGLPDVQLVVAGGPAAEHLDDDREVRRLRRVARQAGVADRVTFCGRVPHEEVPALMRSADVIVTDPWYEPFGIVPLEAMACGRPVVASAVGGHLDTVREGETGFLVPPRDAAALSSRLKTLLTDAELAACIGAQGVRRVRALYTWDRVAAETEAVYRHVLEAAGRAARAEAVTR